MKYISGQDATVLELVTEYPAMSEERFQKLMAIVGDDEINIICQAIRELATKRPHSRHYTPDQIEAAASRLAYMAKARQAAAERRALRSIRSAHNPDWVDLQQGGYL